MQYFSIDYQFEITDESKHKMPVPPPQHLTWFNEPPNWSHEGDTIVITTSPKSDFWRKTHYSFIRDNGHFYYQSVQGDFTLTAHFQGEYRDLYDQAGIMLRLDETTWVKAGIEFVDGVQQISTVVTREYSDWSVTPSNTSSPSIWIQLKRISGACEAFYSYNGEDFHMMRTFYLTDAESLDVGLMCASPEGDGFTVTFDTFTIVTPA